MNYDIRKISDYMKNVHSRYYVDTNGVIYTSMSNFTDKIMVDGKKYYLKKIKNKYLLEMNRTNKMIAKIQEIPNGKYYFLYDGTILHRLSTRIDNGVVDVSLILVNGRSKGDRVKVHRIVAQCFIGDIEGKEIHHIDQDRTNNKLDNLKILSIEDHRGKGNHSKNHKGIGRNNKNS